MEANTLVPEMLKIASVISVPMCGWNPHWGCQMAALSPLLFSEHIVNYGAWWDHGISNAFEDCIEQGVDWILTLDYDSMFTCQDVSMLLKRFGDSPEIDALAALQCRRGSEETAILSTGNGLPIEVVDGSPFPVQSAHFGLTLFRAEALVKVPKPWMMHRPDANGSYRTLARLDPDIYFWRKWAGVGNTLHVDPMVRIGHIQPMVSEFDENFQPRHVHFMEWRQRSSRIVRERDTKPVAVPA